MNGTIMLVLGIIIGISVIVKAGLYALCVMGLLKYLKKNKHECKVIK